MVLRHGWPARKYLRSSVHHHERRRRGAGLATHLATDDPDEVLVRRSVLRHRICT